MRGSRVQLPLVTVVAMVAFAVGVAPAAGQPIAQIKPIKVGKYRVQPGSAGGLLRPGRGTIQPQVFTTVKKGGRSVDYSAPSDVATAKHIKGKIGDFGKLDLRFHKSGPFKKQKLPHGCHGTHSKEQQGSWKGVFKFAGEHGIAKVTRHTLKGSLIKPGDLECSSSPRKLVSLSAHMNNTFFDATVRKSGGKPELSATEFGQKGDVSISRDSFAKTKPSAFSYAADYSSATVKGSEPFSGTGHFAGGMRPHKGNVQMLGVLAGNLKVSFLGKAGKTSLSSNDAQLGEVSSFRPARALPGSPALRLGH